MPSPKSCLSRCRKEHADTPQFPDQHVADGCRSAPYRCLRGAGAAPGPDRDRLLPRPADEVRDDQEVAGEAHLADDPELLPEPLAIVRGAIARLVFRVPAREHAGEPGVRLRLQVILGGPALRHRERGQERLPKLQVEVAAARDERRVFEGLRHVAEQLAQRVGLRSVKCLLLDHALQIVRNIVNTLPQTPPRVWQKLEAMEPAHDPAEIAGILPRDQHTSYDVREIISRIIDADTFHEFKEIYGTSLVTGFARIDGHPVGIIANNGILFSESSLKGAHFIELADQRGIPLLFLQNISGFMVGKDYEAGGIAKNGAKMVTAVSTTRVPKITVVIGGSFGAGNYSMCGRAYSPRFLFMWPNARISVMGPDQAAGVLATVKRDQYEAAGEDWSAEEEAEFKQPILDQYNAQGSAYYSTARLWDDGIIDPQDTRRIVAMALDVCSRTPLNDPQFGLFRM